MNRRMLILALAFVFTLVLAAYAAWPRQADLRRFEPADIARLETAMWRDYYEKRYVALFGHLAEGGGCRRRLVTYCRPISGAAPCGDTKKPRTMPGLLSSSL